MAAVFLVTIPSPEFEKTIEQANSKASTNGTSFVLFNNSSNASARPLINSNEDNLQEVKVISDGNQIDTLTEAKNELTASMQAIYDKCMKQELEIGLQNLNIENSTWTLSPDGHFFQVVFPCESQERCEAILHELYYNGIGRLKESSVGVVPCSVFNRSKKINEDFIDNLKDIELNKIDQNIEDKKSLFLKSIKARLTVAQVVDDIRSGTLITFDFVALLLLAGLIAGFGLMSNSSVSIVASMLVSPLMGPIMALSFGWVISDKQLLKLGIKAELVGLFICISIGLILGLINAPWALGWGFGPWPTGEMFGRGQIKTLWIGMLVALPSGAGVALSILGGNISGLVGVAISASLLPPCVNAGILWGNAIVLALKAAAQDQMKTIIYNHQNLTEYPALLPSEDYVVQYSTNMSYESGALGAISLCLALVNIGSIILMAIVVFKIKEVAPPGSMPATSRFWREDIKIARGFNRTIHRNDPDDLGRQFQKEWTAIVNDEIKENVSANDPDVIADLVDMVQEAEEDDVYNTIQQLTHPRRVRRSIRNQLTFIPESGDANPLPPVWDAFRGSSKMPYRSTRRRNLTLVEAKNRNCSVNGRKTSKSLKEHSQQSGDDQTASRFQVTKVLSQDSSQKQVRKPRNARSPSQKFLEANL